MTPGCPARLLRRADVRRLQTLRAGGDVEADPLAFGQGLETRTLDRGEVGEEILAAVFRSDEAETLRVVEPLNSACCHVLNLPGTKIIKGGCPLTRGEDQDGGGARSSRRTADTGLATALLEYRCGAVWVKPEHIDSFIFDIF